MSGQSCGIGRAGGSNHQAPKGGDDRRQRQEGDDSSGACCRKKEVGNGRSEKVGRGIEQVVQSGRRSVHRHTSWRR